MGIRYSALQMHTLELADTLNTILSKKWREMRGLEIVNIGISSLSPVEADAEKLKQLQSATAFRDPRNAAAQLFSAQADAMRTAATNPGGTVTGFVGMNAAQQSAGNAAQLYQMGASAPAADGWTCPSCGTKAAGKFCPECGAKKPEADGWVCACGAVNQGKFCTECGAKKPAGIRQYRCDTCGWQPE